MYKITDSYLFIQANSVFLPKPDFHFGASLGGQGTGPHRVNRAHRTHPHPTEQLVRRIAPRLISAPPRDVPQLTHPAQRYRERIQCWRLCGASCGALGLLYAPSRINVSCL